MKICEHYGYHLKMSSLYIIELSIDPGIWHPIDKDRISLHPIEFHLEEEAYKDRIDSYRRNIRLTEAVQTGISQLNGIHVAVGVIDFQFMGVSMEFVSWEKVTHLIEYTTNKVLTLIIIVSASEGRCCEVLILANYH